MTIILWVATNAVIMMVSSASGGSVGKWNYSYFKQKFTARGVPKISMCHLAELGVRLARGFVYLVAVIDWYSRKALAWRVSNTLDSGFCVDCLEQALRTHGYPEMFNSDKGCQFTSDAFTGVLKRHGIAISMDGWAGIGQHLRGASLAL